MSLPQPDQNADELLRKAADLRKAGDEAGSCIALREYLQRERALLWLAKMTSEPLEAFSAAELAFRLNASDEVAQRAIRAARERIEAMPQKERTHSELSTAVVLTTGMTLREAQAVIWPFRGINQPIGEALASGQIKLRDLGWALEHTRGQVLTAVRTILFTQIADVEPAKLPQPLHVVTGSRYAERQERRSLIFSIFAASGGLAVCVAMIISGTIGLWFGAGLLSWVALIVFVPAAFYLDRKMSRLNETAISYRHGRWGEERIIENMRALLDDNWTLFRNCTLPNRRGGDIDMILVGPAGIWAFEIKTYSGEIRNIEDQWQRKGKRGWYTLFRHPGSQARGSAGRLKQFLAEQKIPINYVQPVVIWASSSADDFEVEGTLTVERPRTPVWKIDDLSDQIERIIQEEPALAQNTVNQIADLLTTMAAAARRQEREMNRKSRNTSAQTR